MQRECMADHQLPALPIMPRWSLLHTGMGTRTATEWLQSTCQWHVSGEHSEARRSSTLSQQPPTTRPAAGRAHASPSSSLRLLVNHFTPEKLWLSSNCVTSNLSCSEKWWHLTFCFNSEVSTKRFKSKKKLKNSQQAVEGFQCITYNRQKCGSTALTAYGY